MEITFLGTSSAVHSYTRSHPSIAIKAFGETMLFDCGEGTQRQLIFAKISPMKISKIFISHYHGDHILGIPGLLQSMNFRGRETKLTIYGPKGLYDLKEAVNNLGFPNFDFPLEWIEIDTGTIIENEEYVIKAQKVRHNAPTLAYSIEELKKPRFQRQKAIELGVPVGPDFGKLHKGIAVEINGKVIKPEQVLGPPRKGHKLTYSGDTMPCEEMIEFAKNREFNDCEFEDFLDNYFDERNPYTCNKLVYFFNLSKEEREEILELWKKDCLEIVKNNSDVDYEEIEIEL